MHISKIFGQHGVVEKTKTIYEQIPLFHNIPDFWNRKSATLDMCGSCSFNVLKEKGSYLKKSEVIFHFLE